MTWWQPKRKLTAAEEKASGSFADMRRKAKSSAKNASASTRPNRKP